MKNIIIKQRIEIVKFVDRIHNDMLTIATFCISYIKNLSRKKHNISLLLILLFGFSGFYLNGQQAIMDKQVLGSGGMIDLYDNSGIIMSGLVTQTAIEEMVLRSNGDSMLIDQGFWVPLETLIPVDETTINISKDLHNYPNPFSAHTKISYEIYGTSNVSIRIFDVIGKLIKVKSNEIQEMGQHGIDWDAKDQSGTEVSSGVYLIELDVKPVHITDNSSKPFKLRALMVKVN